MNGLPKVWFRARGGRKTAPSCLFSGWSWLAIGLALVGVRGAPPVSAQVAVPASREKFRPSCARLVQRVAPAVINIYACKAVQILPAQERWQIVFQLRLQVLRVVIGV